MSTAGSIALLSAPLTHHGANTLLLQLLDDALNIILLGNTNLVDTDKLGFQLAKQILAK